MNICIIPAKSHSTRIPEKNIKEFCGRPVIEYTLEAVRDSGCFDKIVVSTDSDRIGAIATRYGAIYYKRAAEFMADETPMVDAVMEVLRDEKSDYDTVCMAYACSPFIKESVIRDAYSQHEFHDADVTTAIYRSCEHAEYSMLIRDGKLIPRHPEYKDVNSNLFPDTYQNAGQFYIADVDHLSISQTLTPANMWGVIVEHGIDIDTPEDWARAEALYILSYHPSLMKWSMQNAPIIAECEAMAKAAGYGSITVNYQKGEVVAVEKAITTRQKWGDVWGVE